MLDRLRNAWFAFTAPSVTITEKDADVCPVCGSGKVIDVTTMDMPLNQKRYLCGNCNHSWQRDSTSE